MLSASCKSANMTGVHQPNSASATLLTNTLNVLTSYFTNLVESSKSIDFMSIGSSIVASAKQRSVSRPEQSKHTHIHTNATQHTHPFNRPLSRTTRESQYQKGKTNLDFTEATDSEWQWHQLGRMQICTCSRQITTPAPHHSVFYRPDALPAAQPTVSKHWRQIHTYILKTCKKVNQPSCQHTDYTMPGCSAHIRFTGLEPAVGLHPALWTVHHISSTTTHYLADFYTGAKLDCLVTETYGCKQLAHTGFVANSKYKIQALFNDFKDPNCIYKHLNYRQKAIS